MLKALAIKCRGKSMRCVTCNVGGFSGQLFAVCDLVHDVEAIRHNLC